jgi:hypothetical protein
MLTCRIQTKVMPSRPLRISARLMAVAVGWLRVSLCVLGFEWGEAVQREPEAGDPFEQPVEMRLVRDQPDDLSLTVMGANRHPVERGGKAWSQFSTITSR